MATEQDWLSSLGITDPATQASIISGTTRLLLLDASAHMDWDWLLPFPVLTNYDGPTSNPQTCDPQQSRAYWYFHGPNGTDPGVGPVTQILDGAGALLANASYRYSICETGFLRGYAQTDPAGFQTLLANGGGGANARLRSAGGGITSPDNLLPHGEAFIRDYLMGQAWLAANAPQIPAGATLWIPDDFGHDPQLPVLAQAMGMIAAGFERIPGTNDLTPLDGSPALSATLAANKIDFLWTADDGSQMVGHWLIGQYGQGNNISATSDIESYLALNATPSPTPYIYVPVLSDFSLPNKNLASVVDAWNAAPPSPYQNVIAVCGSFEVYAQLIGFHASQMVTTYGTPFNANPFFTGCYGSRPGIKIRHQRAVRALLAAETFSLIATWGQPGGGSGAMGTGGTYTQELADAWNILLPSTHHDFITGTAIPDVFHTEQMSLLRQADRRASWLLRDALRTIAGAIQPPATFTGQAVAVFNTLGFARGGIVELTAKQVRDASVSVPATGAQVTPDGGLLFIAPAPSLGYQTIDLSALVPPANPVKPVSQTASSVVLANGLISATLTPGIKGVWGLTSVVDVATGSDLVPPGRVLNDLTFYADGGNEYKFGPEAQPLIWTLTDVSAYLSNPTIAVVEQGLLRATVRTAVTYDDGANPPIEFVREYILHAGEPMLRMRTTGAAPVSVPDTYSPGVSVLVAFPLSPEAPLDSLQRGTPSHWTGVMPTLYWNDQTFIPTHNFVIPGVGTEMACAIYHADVPAWGLSNRAVADSTNSDGRVLYGCLWRNGVGQYFTSWVCQAPNVPLGSDPDVHVREYALRLPVANAPDWPATGQPLQESLAFASPLLGMTVAPISGRMPPTMSLAASAESSALVTVAKPGTVDPGDVILRVYQPTNTTLPIALTLASNLAPAGGGAIVVSGQTALEQPLSAANEARLNLTSTSTTVSFTAPTALTTLAITPSASLSTDER
jgi:alpha-mannosidase